MNCKRGTPPLSSTETLGLHDHMVVNHRDELQLGHLSYARGLLELVVVRPRGRQTPERTALAATLTHQKLELSLQDHRNVNTTNKKTRNSSPALFCFMLTVINHGAAWPHLQSTLHQCWPVPTTSVRRVTPLPLTKKENMHCKNTENHQVSHHNPLLNDAARQPQHNCESIKKHSNLRVQVKQTHHSSLPHRQDRTQSPLPCSIGRDVHRRSTHATLLVTAASTASTYTPNTRVMPKNSSLVFMISACVRCCRCHTRTSSQSTTVPATERLYTT